MSNLRYAPSGSIEKECQLEGVDGIWRDVIVQIGISGDYRPATWGYSGGDPEEFPEIEIEKIEDAETGEVYKESFFNKKQIENLLQDELETWLDGRFEEEFEEDEDSYGV